MVNRNPGWFEAVDAAAVAVVAARTALYARQAAVAAHEAGVRRMPVLDPLWEAVERAWECLDDAKRELVRVAIGEEEEEG